MADEIVQIPKAGFVEAKEFYDSKANIALENCIADDRRALFIPELADARISLPRESRIWKNWYSAPSIRVTGKTKQGTPVVVYAHIQNYFSKPKNLKQGLNALRNGAGPMPKAQFRKLLDLEDNETVFVVDYTALKCSSSGVINIRDALKHPQTVPFLGGQERAEAYLAKHAQVYGNKIGVWHSDDLDEQPRGRLLVLGYDYLNGLIGYSNLNYLARFLGVRSNVAEGGAQKISGLEKLAGKGTNVGNGLIVIKKQEIGAAEYRLLTGKQ